MAIKKDHTLLFGMSVLLLVHSFYDLYAPKSICSNVDANWVFIYYFITYLFLSIISIFEVKSKDIRSFFFGTSTIYWLMRVIFETSARIEGYDINKVNSINSSVCLSIITILILLAGLKWLKK